MKVLIRVLFVSSGGGRLFYRWRYLCQVRRLSKKTVKVSSKEHMIFDFEFTEEKRRCLLRPLSIHVSRGG